MRPSRLLALAALTASLPLAASLAAQQHFTLKKIVFRGNTAYTQEQMQAESGLKPGQSITTADLTAAAQKLMDSGVFKDVDPSLDGPVAGITAIFKVAPVPATDLLPTSIDNLVWLDPKQLPSELHRRVPLYSDRLPQAGNLGTEVREALQAMLAEKSITYKVALVDTPSTDTAPETLHFRIDDPVILLKNVRLNGLTPQTAAPLRESLKTLVGKPYYEGTGASLDDQLLTPFRNTGYLDATVTGLTRTATADPSGTVGVIIAGTVDAGQQYHVGTLTYTPTALYASDRFTSTQKLHNGDIASQEALEQTYQPVLDAYHERGYVDARIDLAPQRDAATHTISYTVSLIPGQPYTIGALHADGLSGQALTDFNNNWRLKPGTVYDALYPKFFLRKNTALRSLLPYTAIYDTKADPATHTVDLAVHFLANNNPGR